MPSPPRSDPDGTTSRDGRTERGPQEGSAAAVADLEQLLAADVLVALHAVGLEAVAAVEVPCALVGGQHPEAHGCVLAGLADDGAHELAGHAVAPGRGLEVDRVHLELAAGRVLVAARADRGEPQQPRAVLRDPG